LHEADWSVIENYDHYDVVPAALGVVRNEADQKFTKLDDAQGHHLCVTLYCVELCGGVAVLCVAVVLWVRLVKSQQGHSKDNI